MSVGLSGSYALNGTNLTLQPTEGRWGERDSFGMDGSGHPIYPSVRTFELSWELISTSELQQVINFFNAVGNTGTVVADLPQYGAAAYQFYAYSGCTLNEVMVGAYFQEYVQDTKLLILNIRTN